MPTQISPMLAVSDGNAAIKFYKAAFCAILWSRGDDHVVAALSINGSEFFLATESPPHGARAPASAGFTTVRIELFVDDPLAMHNKPWPPEPSSTVPYGNTLRKQPARAQSGECSQGAVIEPFGHL